MTQKQLSVDWPMRGHLGSKTSLETAVERGNLFLICQFYVVLHITILNSITYYLKLELDSLNQEVPFTFNTSISRKTFHMWNWTSDIAGTLAKELTTRGQFHASNLHGKNNVCFRFLLPSHILYQLDATYFYGGTSELLLMMIH